MIDSGPFKQFPTLSTPRLSLRELSEQDVSALFNIYSDPLVMRYSLEAPYGSHLSARILVRYFKEEYQQQRLIWWGMEHRRDQIIIGTLGLWNIHASEYWAELGFDTASSYWRKGYTYEAIRAVLCFGFEALGLERIIAKTVLQNEPSHRLLYKVGFSKQGYLDPYQSPNNLRVKVRFYELTKEQWHHVEHP